LAVKKYLFSSYSTAKNMPKIAEGKLSSCGLEVAGFRKNCDCGIAELPLQKGFLQVAELRLRTKKKVARAHLRLNLNISIDA
jgi:hypothetical protein